MVSAAPLKSEISDASRCSRTTARRSHSRVFPPNAFRRLRKKWCRRQYVFFSSESTLRNPASLFSWLRVAASANTNSPRSQLILQLVTALVFAVAITLKSNIRPESTLCAARKLQLTTIYSLLAPSMMGVGFWLTRVLKFRALKLSNVHLNFTRGYFLVQEDTLRPFPFPSISGKKDKLKCSCSEV